MGFPPPTVSPLLLLLLLILLHNGLVPAIDDLISDHQQKFRVHFFRGPDGQWLSLLNLRVVFQTPDIVDVEEESVEESLDFDDDDDWTVVTLDPIIRPQKNWTQPGTDKFGDDGYQKLAENEKKKEQKKQEASLEEAITLERKSQEEWEKEMADEKVENGSVEQENEEELIPTGPVPELSLLQDILPWIPHLLRRHHKVHKTPSKTRTSPQQQRRLHLEEILGRSSNATVSPAQMENATETVIGSSSAGEDGQPVEEKTQLPSTSTIPEEMTTESPPPLEPINEEELALNLHKDSLHRNESVLRQMFTNVSTSKMGIDEKARRDHSSETFRDLGGSFILPLLKELKYDNKSIPLVFPDESLKVTVSLEILHLGNFDNFQMEYELDVLFHLQWFDVRLANNFTKSVRIKEQQIIDKIWKPDTLFFNSKYSYFHLVSFPNFLMRIQPNGHITYTSRVTLLPDCQMNFCNFPHDTQRCDLLISSIAHPQSMLEYSWDREQPIVFGRKISLPDLHIQKIATDHCEIKSKLIPSSCLTLQFELERDSARYIAEKYLPSTLAMIFSWVAPYVPYNYEEVRIITPITVLLTLVQMEKGNQEVMTSYLTSLDIWFVVIKGFTVLSLVESLTVMAYIKRGRAIEKQAQRAVNEYQKEMLQMEAKHIVRVYHRLDHWSRVCFPVAFLCFLIFYLGFIVQRDEQSCREQLIDLSTLESII